MSIEKSAYTPEANRLLSAEGSPPSIDPIGAWEDIRNSHGAEAGQKLKEFREKLYYQKEQIARFQSQVIDFLHENQELEIDEQASFVLSLSEENGFSGMMEEMIIDTLDRYAELRLKVQDWLRDYPDGPSLYEALFNRYPSGEVEIIKGPMTILLRCHNLDDFAFVDLGDQSASQVSKDSDVRKMGQTAAGISLGDFDGLFLLENASLLSSEEESRQIVAHEEQHAVARLFSESTRLVEIDQKSQGILARISRAKSNEERLVLLRAYFRLQREPIDERASDEILANVAEGVPGTVDLASIFNDNNGTYDFIQHHQHRFNARIEDAVQALGEDHRDMVLAAYSEIVDVAYQETIKCAANAVSELEYYGYTSGEIIGLLLHVPLSKWQDISGKVIDQRLKSLADRFKV